MKYTILLLCTAISLTATAQTKKITVAQDGSGTYKTVQAAIDAVPAGNTIPVEIYIKKGVYKEMLNLPAGKNFVTMKGEDKDKTIITYNNHTGGNLPNGTPVNTYNSATFFIYGNDFSASDLTFTNDAGFSAGQAVAVFANGDKLRFNNCRFTGFQDVLFCSGYPSRQYYKNCYIEGTTDFIFGPSTAVFQSCEMHSKKNSHVTAASTPGNVLFGFVFFDCKLTADTGLHNVSLGRPWKPTASVTYIRCKIGDHILSAGWNNWGNPANEATARFAEYDSTGPGAKPAGRVKWSKQLTKEEATKITLPAIFGDWDPTKR
jgi:pectinesterase